MRIYNMDKRIKAKAQELYPIESRANEHTAFLQGAKRADKTMVEKACHWLEDTDFDMEYWNSENGFCKREFIEDFRKAMER